MLLLAYLPLLHYCELEVQSEAKATGLVASISEMKRPLTIQFPTPSAAETGYNLAYISIQRGERDMMFNTYPFSFDMHGIIWSSLGYARPIRSPVKPITSGSNELFT